MDLTEFKIFKTVGEHELETNTRSGWRVVQVLKEQTVQMFTDNVAVSVGNGSYPQMMSVNKSHICAQHKYLLGLQSEAEVWLVQKQEYEEQSKYIIELNKILNESCEKLKKDLAGTIKQNEGLSNTIGSLSKERQGLAETKDQLNSTIKQMEEDIQKVINSIGILQWREIL